MACKLSITIPDELGTRLEAVKTHFNVSGVCAAALESEVRRQELSMKEDKTMADTIERLRSEKREALQSLRDDAREVGYKGAKDMSYTELCEAKSVDDGEEVIHRTVSWDNWLKDQVENAAEEWDMFDEDIYIEGWLEGVMKFWEEVQGQI